MRLFGFRNKGRISQRQEVLVIASLVSERGLPMLKRWFALLFLLPT
jgi:hypothetical protein